MRLVNYYPRAVSDRSGVTEALWSWAAALVDAGQEVVVLHAGGPHHSPDPRHVRPNLRDEAIAHRGGGRASHRPVDIGRHLRPDDLLILHEGWVLSNLVAARAARRIGCPYIVVPHGVYEPGIRRMLKPPHRLRELLERRLLERAAAVHVFFESEIALVRSLAPDIRAAIVAPHGFEFGEERWSGGGGYLAWLGRYDPPHKGLDILLRAMARLSPDERPRLVLRGPDYNGGYRATRQLIDQLDLGAWVTADGPVRGAEKVEFLRRCEGYVMPSRWDSHPIALIENLGLGVPCLVSSAIHLAGPLAAAEAALLAPPTDEGFADGLRRLTSADPTVGERGRRFLESFDWPTVTARFLDGVAALPVVPVGRG